MKSFKFNIMSTSGTIYWTISSTFRQRSILWESHLRFYIAFECSKIGHLRLLFWVAIWLVRPLFKVTSFLKIISFYISFTLLCRVTCLLRPFEFVNFSGPPKQVLLYLLLRIIVDWYITWDVQLQVRPKADQTILHTELQDVVSVILGFVCGCVEKREVPAR